MSDDNTAVVALFDRYAAALGAGDLPGIADCYATPALVIADDLSLAVPDRRAVEAAFAGAADAYHAKGLTGARPTVQEVEAVAGHVLMCAVDWQYVDQQGGVVPGERYRYLLRVAPGGPRISVVIPVP